MKIIDLLNKIANGEEVPNKIKWEDQEWKYNPINDYEGIKYGGCLLNQLTLDRLNDEVGIIEEEKKIPDKWNDLSFTTMRKKEDSIDDDIHKLKGYIETIMRTQNEIIDYIKSKGDE